LTAEESHAVESIPTTTTKGNHNDDDGCTPQFVS